MALLLLIFLKFLSCAVERNQWALLKTLKASERAQGGVLISRWLVQRISHGSGSKMLTGNYTPLHKGKQKREYLLFFYTYTNLEKWAGEMSAVIIAILTPDGFRYFVFRSCYTGRQLLLFLISNPNHMWCKSNSHFTAKTSDVMRSKNDSEIFQYFLICFFRA